MAGQVLSRAAAVPTGFFAAARLLPFSPTHDDAALQAKNATPHSGQRAESDIGPRMAADLSASANYSSGHSGWLSSIRHAIEDKSKFQTKNGRRAHKLGDGSGRRESIDHVTASPRRLRRAIQYVA
jgi:hypothetical protein